MKGFQQGAKKVLPFLFIGALSALPFVRHLDAPFLHDDKWAVESNPVVIEGVHLGKILTTNSWGNQPDYPHMHYRPLSVMTLALTWKFAKGDAFWFRLENLMMHMGVSILLYCLLRKVQVMLRGRVAPLAAEMASAWFAVHPVHVETVMFVVNREELLATFFYLLSLLVVIGGVWGGGNRDFPKKFRKVSVLVISLLEILGLAGKETGITFPVLVLVILIVWRRERLVENLPLVLALFVAALGFVGWRAYVLGRVFSDVIPWQDNPLVLGGLWERITGAFTVFWEAAELIVAPLNLSVDYGFDVLGLPTREVTFEALLGMFVALLLLVSIFVFRQRQPVVAFGLLMALVAYLPFSNLLFLNSIVLAERNLYLPSAGAALMLCGLFGVLGGRMVKGATIGFMGVVVLGFTWVSMERASDFRSAKALFASSLAARPNSTRLHNNLGLALMEEGDLVGAERHILRALEIDRSNGEAWNNLGLLWMKIGRPGAAEGAFREALRVRPRMTAALNNLCLLLVTLERYEEALSVCEEAARRGGKVGEAIRTLWDRGQCKGPFERVEPQNRKEL